MLSFEGNTVQTNLMPIPTTKTILVIEDERVTRMTLLEFLTNEGFTAIGAENGAAGVQSALENLPDLIICDIMMPDLDGYDVLTTLQRNAETARIPFIFLTMSASVEGCQQSLEMGADDYLAKPVSSEQLRRSIAAQLDKAAVPPSSNLANITDLAFSEKYPADASLIKVWAELPEGELKNLLLERFCQLLLQRLTALRSQVERFQEFTLTPEQALSARQVQREFSQLVSWTNEVSALQKILTPENAENLLASFPWLNPLP
jgi:two-component system, OmpR family, alkaline phosphatase synthesis response regulator PhoP